MPLGIFAQDTLYVPPLPAGNLNAVIKSDTLPNGAPAHVYKLRRGTIYQISEAMNIKGSITIIANDSAGIRPPVLAPAIATDNSSPDHFFYFIGKGMSVFMRDLYMTSQRADNNWVAWPSAIVVTADSVKLKLRGVIFDGWGEAIHQSFWLKTDVQDCKFRNMQHTSSWFHGDPFFGDGTVCLDTTLWFNNTFFANNSYTINARGYSPLIRWEHNTMLYSVVNPFLIRQAVNIHINNNVFYCQHAMQFPDPVISAWFFNYPDTGSSSMIRIRGLDSTSYWAHLWWDATNNRPSVFTGPEVWVDAAHGVTAAMLDATKRVFDAQNNLWFLPTRLTDFYKAFNDTTTKYDSINVPVYEAAANPKTRTKRIFIAPTYLTSYAKWSIDSGAGKVSPYITIPKVPIQGDPGFPANVTNHVDSLIWYLHSIITDKIDGVRRWGFPNNRLYPPTWPLPENLAYTNTALLHAGTDGYALGDLNWFPDQKATWKPTDVRLIDQLPEAFSLSQNYPNPFNPSTTIEFSLPKQSKVTLTVYNILGQEVATLVSATLSAGRYSAQFNGSKVSSGTYIYRLTADNFIKTSKMLLIK
jgi:hypothetical protein